MITLDLVRRAMRQPLPGLAAQLRMAPPDRIVAAAPASAPRDAGVLLLLYPREGGLHFVLMRRTEHPGVHSGQISFPGGRREPGDADVVATALRETREELGSDLRDAQILGPLTRLYVPPSNFLVHPTVAALGDEPVFLPEAREVAEVIEVPLPVLFDPAIRAVAPRALASRGGQVLPTPYFGIGGHQVWGATAMILAEFAALLTAAAR